MPRSRSSQISLEDTNYYHCCSRVVRRAFLCGDDKYSGKNYDHRRAWVEALLLKLSSIFAIDIAAYAVMSNHLHVVLAIDAYKVNEWSDVEVIQQWQKLFKGTELTQQFAKGELVEAHQVAELKHQIATYRARLCDISWFMRCLNEPIARQANKEDNCTGRFWEGRFKSQALLDEGAVLACMAYVDLNPIRAGMAPTPETSEYTSVKLRVQEALNGKQPKPLLPFIGNERENQPKGIAFDFKGYLQLVDDTGRIIREDKRGYISQESQAILDRINIPAETWVSIVSEFGKIYHGAVGNTQEFDRYCAHMEKRRKHFAMSCRYLDG